MRDLRRNLSPVFFRTLEGEEEIVDQYGNVTGSFIPLYSEIKSALLAVSPNKGDSEVSQYGSLLDYDRVMTTSDTSCEIDEDSVLWLDNADTSGPWNAIVKRRSPSLNGISYAVKRVTVSQYTAQQKEISAARAAMKKAASTNADD